MGIVDIFSKRQRRLRREIPDVYQYADLPITFRRQVVFILRDVLENGDLNDPDQTDECFQAIHDLLAREFGVFKLDEHSRNPQEGVLNFLLHTGNVEKALSVIELSLRLARQAQQEHWVGYPKMTVNEAVVELNTRFREHGIGYQFESNKIVRVDSQFLHQEAVKPALQLLSATHYAGANKEFLAAHEHYRHQRYGEAINECLKALESTLKVICKQRRWPVDETTTAKKLLQIVFEQDLVPNYLQSQFSGLQSVLESGVPTIRNREGGHGAGAEPRQIPQHLAAYALHLTASAIVFLSQCDKK